MTEKTDQIHTPVAAPPHKPYAKTKAGSLLKYDQNNPATGPKSFALVYEHSDAGRAIYLVDNQQGFFQAVADYACPGDDIRWLSLPAVFPCLVEYHIPRTGPAWDQVLSDVVEDAEDFLSRYEKADTFETLQKNKPLSLGDLLNGWARDAYGTNDSND